MWRWVGGRIRILGIDPGSSATGFGLVERQGSRILYLAHGTLRPPRSAALPERLAFLHAALVSLLAERAPDCVAVERVFVRRMKTNWGSCNAGARSIRLNTDLAKKPVQCLEYVVVHKLVPLLERRHNDRFTALMDRYLSHWRHFRKLLNTAPLGYESWSY